VRHERLRPVFLVLFCTIIFAGALVTGSEARKPRPSQRNLQQKSKRNAKRNAKRITKQASQINDHRERSAKEDELSRLKKEIADFQRQLKDHEAKAVRSRQNISAFNRRTEQIKRAIEALESRIDELEEKQVVVEDSLKQTASTLDRLRSAYASGARYLYINGSMRERSPDEVLLSANTTDDHARQQYYAGLVARAHSLNREKLDSVKRALGVSQRGISSALSYDARVMNERADEAEQIEQRKQDEARHLAEIEQNREKLRKTLKQKQESAQKLERMIADLILREEKAATLRRKRAEAEAARKKSHRETAHAEKPPKFQDDLKEPGRIYGPHSFHWPITSHQIRQGFGEHRNTELNTVTMNLGIDIAAPRGSPVFAAADGIVSLVSSLPSYGTIIVLQHANGLHTVYADLSGVAVRSGAHVTAGQTIGRSGANEESGSLLHFEVWKGKTRQNPMGWLK
jgi:septal ring factor EnvC (AmiA/AmiB activator)